MRRWRRAVPAAATGVLETGALAIGVEVGTACVRAVVLRRGSVVWADTRTWGMEAVGADDTPGSLEVALTALLTSARAVTSRRTPAIVGRRPSVYVALAPRFAQLKRLTGLPATPDAWVATAFVQDHAGQLFLRNGTPIVTGGIRAVAPDHADVWAGAYHSPIVADVVCACARAGTRCVGLGSVATTLGLALAPVGESAPRAGADRRDDAIRAPDCTWADEDVVLDLWFAGRERRVTNLRRTPQVLRSSEGTPERTGAAHGTTDDTLVIPRADPAWHTALVALGPAYTRFAAAFGAARIAAYTHVRDPVSLVFTPRGLRAILRARRAARETRATAARPAPRWRVGVAALACVVGLGSAIAAPGLAATRDARRAGAVLRALGPRRAVAAAAAADLARATDVLRAATPEGGGRPSPVRLLADLARVLPVGAALADVQLDGAEGRIVAVAPNAAAVVAALARVPALDDVEIVGPVTHEEALATPAMVPTTPPTPHDTAASPRASERVAVRFRVLASPSVRDASTPAPRHARSTPSRD